MSENEGLQKSIIDLDNQAIISFRKEISKATPTDRQRIIEKFILAALGSIPWVGGFLSAAASYKTEEGGLKANDIQTKWLEEHALKLTELQKSLEEILVRLEFWCTNK